jgi:predicted nuclease of predicted toxin-antitoxin system
MRFLVDESAGKRLSDLLVQSGQDSVFVGDVMAGATDEDVLARAEKESRILITDDKDFGELVFRLNRPVSGVILLRGVEASPSRRFELLSKLLRKRNLEGSFVSIRKDRIRVRKLPTKR